MYNQIEPIMAFYWLSVYMQHIQQSYLKNSRWLSAFLFIVDDFFYILGIISFFKIVFVFIQPITQSVH